MVPTQLAGGNRKRQSLSKSSSTSEDEDDTSSSCEGRRQNKNIVAQVATQWRQDESQRNTGAEVLVDVTSACAAHQGGPRRASGIRRERALGPMPMDGPCTSKDESIARGCRSPFGRTRGAVGTHVNRNTAGRQQSLINSKTTSVSKKK